MRQLLPSWGRVAWQKAKKVFASICSLTLQRNIKLSQRKLNLPAKMLLKQVTFLSPFSLILKFLLTGLSCTGEPRTGQRTPGMASPVLRGRIPSLDLLAKLLLMQPRMPLALFVARARCGLTFNLAPNIFTGLFRPRCRTLYFLWNLINRQPVSPASQGPTGWHLPRDWSEADRLAVPWVLPPANP